MSPIVVYATKFAKMNPMLEDVVFFNFKKNKIIKKVAGLKACYSIKKVTPTQVFSCELCKVLKNIFFHRPSPTAASVKNFLYYLFIPSISSKNSAKR